MAGFSRNATIPSLAISGDIAAIEGYYMKAEYGKNHSNGSYGWQHLP